MGEERLKIAEDLRRELVGRREEMMNRLHNVSYFLISFSLLKAFLIDML